MGSFKLKQKIKLSEMTDKDVLPESDYASLTPDGFFVQLTYIEDEKEYKDYEVKPGSFYIVKTPTGLDLAPTQFNKDDIMEEFVSTKEIEDAVDCFFNNLHLYKEFGIEVPKRGVLLYGPAGGGKTTALNKAARKYLQDTKTLVITWHTSQFDAGDVQSFIRSFKYVGVDKFILIAEDLGGIENDQTRMKSDSSLLSLLDNQEQTFSIPIMIIATTNFPENFMGNLTNRPGRFDDKIKVGYPGAKERGALLNFFAKDYATYEAVELIKSDKCKEFSPAQIKESYIRSRLRSKKLVDTINEVIVEIQKYNKGFSDQKGLGFN